MAGCLEQVWMIERDAAESVAGTNPRDGAFIAIQASIMTHLKKKRTVAKAIATLDTFGATNAKLFINRVFVIRIFNESAFYCGGRAQLILGAGIQVVWGRLEITGAQLAITAQGITVDALYGGLLENAVGCAVIATQALLGIDLPDCALRTAAPGDEAHQDAQTGDRGHPRTVAQKLPACNDFARLRFFIHGLVNLSSPGVP
jgi:hypothetical protein